MENKFDNNLKNLATKKRIWVYTSLWFISTALLLMVTTNLFTENPFRGRYMVFGFMMLINTVFIIRLWRQRISANRISE